MRRSRLTFVRTHTHIEVEPVYAGDITEAITLPIFDSITFPCFGRVASEWPGEGGVCTVYIVQCSTECMCAGELRESPLSTATMLGITYRNYFSGNCTADTLIINLCDAFVLDALTLVSRLITSGVSGSAAGGKREAHQSSTHRLLALRKMQRDETVWQARRTIERTNFELGHSATLHSIDVRRRNHFQRRSHNIIVYGYVCLCMFWITLSPHPTRLHIEQQQPLSAQVYLYVISSRIKH